ncbi:MAG: hypothetical protein H6860_04080 [Rhodospirillales bacterium]|nr:hypothetical protein [Alphaproteobacteria bacterium]MCB9981558.1 hypothetical protein [Rhodospirillales bacterium]
MIPFDPVTAGTALILAASSPQICQMTTPADISVVPKTAELVIDTSRTSADLQGQSIDTINPYGYNNVTHTNGFMEGQINMRSSVELDYRLTSMANAYCIYYKKVTIMLDITPKIVIAKEVSEDSCMYSAVLEHEMKHVNADRKIVNKYAQTIGKKVFDGLQQRGFIAGPIASENAQAIMNRMKSTVSQLVQFEYKKMEIERAEAQQAIDNLAEYQFVQSRCPDYKSPLAASRGQ